MNLQTKLKRVIELLEKNPGVLPQVAKEVKALEPRLDAILDALESWNGIDWRTFAELEVAVARLNAKSLSDLNDRLKPFGVELGSANKRDKASFVIEATRAKNAHSILAELRRPAPNPVEDAFFELAKLTSGAEARIHKMRDAEVKNLLSYLQIKVPTRPGKKTFDRVQANELLATRVRDTGLRIRH